MDKYTYMSLAKEAVGREGAWQWYVCAPPPPLLTPHFHFPLGIICFHIRINYLVDNFNTLTEMAVSK